MRCRNLPMQGTYSHTSSASRFSLDSKLISTIQEQTQLLPPNIELKGWKKRTKNRKWLHFISSQKSSQVKEILIQFRKSLHCETTCLQSSCTMDDAIIVVPQDCSPFTADTFLNVCMMKRANFIPFVPHFLIAVSPANLKGLLLEHIWKIFQWLIFHLTHF